MMQHRIGENDSRGCIFLVIVLYDLLNHDGKLSSAQMYDRNKLISPE